MDVQKAKEIWETMTDEEKARVVWLLGHKPTFVEPEPQKDERKTAYIVTEGEYSDYRIVAWFSSEKDAKEFIDIQSRRHKRSHIFDYQIEEYREGVGYDWRNESICCVYLRKDGSIRDVKIAYWDDLDDYSNIGKVDPMPFTEEYRIMVIARDNEHAMKQASDIFAKWKAEQEGIT